ncbi:MAG: hypothetical protein RQ968_05650 [Thermoproteota archaeon]|jgi:hypothetical protein|nr:hypothetical protein [Thermoproteota archaeon]
MKGKITKDEFAKVIIQSLNDILGYDTTQALIFHICIRKKFNKEEISNNLDKVLVCLEELFGWASETIFDDIIFKLNVNHGIRIKDKKELIDLAKEVVKSG